MDEMWILEWFDGENLGKGYQVKDFDGGEAPTPIRVVRFSDIKKELHMLTDICTNLSIYSLRLNSVGASFDNKIKGKVLRSDEPTTKAYYYLKHMKERIYELIKKLNLEVKNND